MIVGIAKSRDSDGASMQPIDFLRASLQDLYFFVSSS